MAIFILFFIVSTGVFAQDTGFISHVSQIGVEVRNNLVRLSWVDSPDAQGPVFIFRSARPFGGTIPVNIRPVIVRYGEQFFIDDIYDMENVYYFVAASDISGQRYDIILPRINSTSIVIAQIRETAPTQLVLTPQLPPAAATAAEVIAEPVVGIFNLRASLDGEKVIITFNRTDRHRNAILYRSMQPIHNTQDLLNSAIVQSGITSPFIDLPAPGFTWYYTVIFEDEILSGNMGILPGINTTLSAVTIHSDQIQEQFLRPIPLPILTLQDREDDAFLTRIPGQVPLSIEAANMLRYVPLPQREPLNKKSPRVFAVDLAVPASGEESVLFQIVRDHFINLDWENTRISLQSFLSLPRSAQTEARARFYLGQALYYTGNYRQALMEFLSFRSFNPAEANDWISAVLSALVH